jgi:hypothetical protein
MRELQDFVAECLTVSLLERKSASELLSHHFFDDVDEDAGMVMAMDVLDRRVRLRQRFDLSGFYFPN